MDSRIRRKRKVVCVRRKDCIEMSARKWLRKTEGVMLDLGASMKIKEQFHEEGISQGEKDWAERERDQK